MPERKVPAENQKPNKVGFWKGLWAFIAGNAISYEIRHAYDNTFSNKIFKQMNKLSETNISKEINQAFENSNLKSVGAEIIDVSKLTNPTTEIAKHLRKSVSKTFLSKLYNKTKFGRVYLEKATIQPLTQILVSGKNAAAFLLIKLF